MLPAFLLFGLGLTIMVAPLTTALMTLRAVRNSGIASAINNAISRVGPQLAGAVIFIAITATFYGRTRACRGLAPTRRPAPRRGLAAQTRPPPVPPDRRRGATTASTDAYHLAMLVAAGLLFAGR